MLCPVCGRAMPNRVRLCLAPSEAARCRRGTGSISEPCHDRDVTWPPEVGQPLQNAEAAYNVYEKLGTYALATGHSVGGHKARAFQQILAITVDDVDYLASALLAGVLDHPVTAVRRNAPWGINCNVIIPVQGLREHAERVARVLTSWELRYEGDRPRLVTAFIDE